MDNFDKAMSTLQKDINRLKKTCRNFELSNNLRKYQIKQFHLFTKKLLDEGRITESELAPFIIKKKEAKTILK